MAGAMLWMMVFLLCLAPSWAIAARITPGVTTELGYTDNIQFRGNDQKDFFLRVTPSISITTGTPAHSFSARASAGYTRYLNHGDESEFETVTLGLDYRRELSPRFSYYASNTTSSTHNPVDLTKDNGELVRIEDLGQRSDSNATTVGAQYAWSPFTRVEASYTFIYTRTVGEEESEDRSHSLRVAGSKRLAPHWRGELAMTTGHDNLAVDSERLTSSNVATLVYMMGPRREFWARTVFDSAIALDEDQAGASNIDYNRYEFTVGADYAISPIWAVGGSVGVSYEDTGGGNLAPVYAAYVSYFQQTWSLTLRGEVTYGDAGNFGGNGGLTETRSVNLTYNNQFAQHWNFNLSVGYVEDIPQQEINAQSANRRQYRVATGLSWQTSQYTSWNLSYTYVNVEDESGVDEGSQNEISLFFNYAQPYLW